MCRDDRGAAVRFAIAAVMLFVSAGTAQAETDEPTTYDLFFDGNHQPHPANPKTDGFIEGDSLVLRVDPTRLFPDPNTKTGDAGFAVKETPPEVKGLYVAGPSTSSSDPLSIQAGLCQADEKTEEAAKKAVGDAEKALKQVPKDADAQARKAAQDAVDEAHAALDDLGSVVPKSPTYRCVQSIDWNPVTGAKGYVCGTDPMTKLIDASATWSFVKLTDDKTKAECITDWTLAKASPVTSVVAEVVNGGDEPERIVLATENAKWFTTITLKANTRAVRLTIIKADKTETKRTIPIKVRTRDTHSRLRIQAALLATNRLRAVSFAVALTPVRREFFTEGTGGCVFGCALTMSALLRISGDDKTVVQFGGGVGINFVRAFQVNAGLLFGTSDTNSAWRLERNWFVGIAIDPIMLSEALAAGAKK